MYTFLLKEAVKVHQQHLGSSGKVSKEVRTKLDREKEVAVCQMDSAQRHSLRGKEGQHR